MILLIMKSKDLFMRNKSNYTEILKNKQGSKHYPKIEKCSSAC